MNLVFSRKTRINIGSTKAITATKSLNKHPSEAAEAVAAATVTTLVVALPETLPSVIIGIGLTTHPSRAWQHPV